MNIEDRYKAIRDNITDGCLFLMSKDKFISKTIRRHDRNEDGSWAEFSHIGLIFEKKLKDGRRRLFIIDSNPEGVRPELLSIRLKSCDNFAIIKPLCPKKIIEDEVYKSFGRAENGIKYDFLNGAKELINRRYKTNFKISESDDRDICSDFTKELAIEQDMVTLAFRDLKLPYPQDYLRYRNLKSTEVLR